MKPGICLLIVSCSLLLHHANAELVSIPLECTGPYINGAGWSTELNLHEQFAEITAISIEWSGMITSETYCLVGECEMPSGVLPGAFIATLLNSDTYGPIGSAVSDQSQSMLLWANPLEPFTGTYPFEIYTEQRHYLFEGPVTLSIYPHGIGILPAIYGTYDASDGVINSASLLIDGTPIPEVAKGLVDFNADGMTDTLWRHPNGCGFVRLMDGTTPSTGYVYVGGNADYTPVAWSDFSADGKTDILWQHTNGCCFVRQMNGTMPTTPYTYYGGNADCSLIGLGDFNKDNRTDILWRYTNGTCLVRMIHYIDGTSVRVEEVWYVGGNADYAPAGLGDFNGDGKTDILWRHTNGCCFVDLTSTAGWVYVGGNADYALAGLGDFNADGKTDILWRHTNGACFVRLMNGAAPMTSYVYAGGGTAYTPTGLGDFNADGKTDILWRHTNGACFVRLMNGAAPMTSYVYAGGGATYIPTGLGDFNADGKTDILWRHSNGCCFVRLMNGTTPMTSYVYAGGNADYAPLSKNMLGLLP